MSEILSINQEVDHSSSDARIKLGLLGEELAAEFLKNEGYRFVTANFKVPIGRNSRGAQISGEIDIIALDGETLCFIEVKTRRSDEFTPILTNVDLRKQRQITRTAKVYRRIFGISGIPFRYDVVTVLMPNDAKHKIELIKGFWAESKFRKRNWHFHAWDEFH